MSNVKSVVVDARGHLLGRLSSVIAKQLLNGTRVVVVRTEEINISGSLFRNELKFHAFLNKRMNTNPRKGQVHYRNPARMLWRCIRGMVPHKTHRGAMAMGRLRCFEGIPYPYNKVKRVVVPEALRNIRLKPGRKFCRLGDLANKVGWKHNDLITKLESKRKVHSAAFYETKKTVKKIKKQVEVAVAEKLKPVNDALQQLGY